MWRKGGFRQAKAMVIGMKEQLYGMAAVSVIGAAVLPLFGEKSRLLPYVRFLWSLVLLLTVLSPLRALADDLAAFMTQVPTVSDMYEGGGETYTEAVTDAVIGRVSIELAALITAETGIAGDAMTVALSTVSSGADTEEVVTVTGVDVILHRREHRIASEKIKALVTQTLYCPCTVRLEEE